MTETGDRHPHSTYREMPSSGYGQRYRKFPSGYPETGFEGWLLVLGDGRTEQHPPRFCPRDRSLAELLLRLPN